MSNSYYNHGSTPVTGSAGSSALIRAEFDNIATGFSGVETALGGKQANLVSGTNINTVNGSSLLGSGDIPIYGFKNRIINGDMRIAQRGTSGLPTSFAGAYTLDRWLVASSGSTPTFSQALGTLTTGQQAYLLQITGATGNTWVLPAQNIESLNSRDLAGKTVTVSYELYQNTGSTMPVQTALYYANSIDNFSAVTLISNSSAQNVPTNSITKVTATFSVPASATTGIQVRLCSQLPTLLSGQAIQIGNVQLEPGSVATSFEYRPYGLELALCQRYYETGQFAWTGYQTTGQGYGSYIPFLVPKRVTPSILPVAPNSVNISLPGVGAVSGTTHFYGGGTITTTGWFSYSGTYTASAEL